MSLGISIYPSKDSFERDKRYIEKAASLGYKRVFTCLISQDLKKDELEKLIKKYSDIIHSNEMILSVDTNPKIFKRLGASPYDLSIFKKMGVDIIRLDGDFGEDLNKVVINNKEGIIIEINASIDISKEYIKAYDYDIDKVYTCLNFYPQRYTGHDIETCRKYSKTFKDLGFRLAIFISSQEEETFGPWPVNDGLSTIEECRDLSVDEQIRLIESMGLFDDVFFGNAYASDEELKTAAKYHGIKNTVKLEFDKGVTEYEKNLILNEKHINRHDSNKIMKRSSVTRNIEVEVRDYSKNFKPFDLVLVNENLNYYMGELEIFLQDCKNDGCRNFIGSFEGIEKEILKNIKSNEAFILEEK